MFSQSKEEDLILKKNSKLKEKLVSLDLKVDESKQHCPKSTIISGKHYLHNLSEQDLAKHCLNLPHKDSRAQLRITLIDDKFTFYHDKDVFIDKNLSFIKDLTTASHTQLNSEYLVFKMKSNELKFELKFENLSQKTKDFTKLNKLISECNQQLNKLDLSPKSPLTLGRSILNVREKEKILNYLSHQPKDINNNKFVDACKPQAKTSKLDELIKNSTLTSNRRFSDIKFLDCCSSETDSLSPSSYSPLSSSPTLLNFKSALASAKCESKSEYKLIVPNDLERFFQKKSAEWKSYKKNLVDSHCHFDMLFPRIKFEKDTLEDYFQEYKSFYLDNFEACINVLCDPNKYSNKSRLNLYLNNYAHPKVYLTIGCHPHFSNSWSQQAENQLYSSLSNPRIVAIGECGLDLSRKNNVSLKQQTLVFEAQLRIAKETGMPIVIHCRDTEERVYELLVENLNEDHRIHLHCFTGTWSTAKKYLKTFPNLCIGVTPLITYNSNSNNQLKELVMNIPLDKLLLETDAPYFVPRLRNFPSSVEYSHPGFVFATAECLAELRNVSIDQILDLTRKNIRKVYSF